LPNTERDNHDHRLSDVLDRSSLSRIQRLFHQFFGIHTLFYDAAGSLLTPIEKDSPYECIRRLVERIDDLREARRYEIGEPVSLDINLVLHMRIYENNVCEYEIPFGGGLGATGYVRMFSQATEPLTPGAAPDALCADLHFTAREDIVQRTKTIMPILEAFLLLGERIRLLEGTMDGLAALHTTGQTLTRTLDLQEVLNLIVTLVTENLGVKACALRLLNESTGNLEIRASRNLSKKYLNKGPVMAAGSQIDVQAMQGNIVVSKNLTTDPRVLYPQEMVEEGLSSILCVGLRIRDKAIGVIRAYSAEAHEFDQYDIVLFESLANYAAIAIDYAKRFADSLEKRRIEHELDLAAEIQNRLLPKSLPTYPGYDIAALNIPYKQIGGDFYDFWDIDDKHLGLVIADGSGKSVPGAMLMTLAKAAVRVQAQHVYRTAEIIDQANRFICSQTYVRHFVSLFYGALNLEARVLTCTNAGHNPPVILGSSPTRYIEASGIVLGVDPEAIYTEQQITLVPGDMLLMVTDGVTEAFGAHDEQFGYDRLIEAAKAHRDRSAAEIVQAIRDVVRRFAVSPVFDDDLTVAVIKVL